MSNAEKYLTESEVAKMFRTNKQRIAKWRRAGLLKSVKLSRQWIYKESDCNKFFDEFIGKDLTAEHYLYFKKS